MSAVCGVWRPGAEGGSAGDVELVQSMLARVPYRGDASDVGRAPGITFGIHNWADRDDGEILSTGDEILAHAGSVISPSGNSLRGLRAALESPETMANLDGAFAVAWVDRGGARLRLLRDPFGVRSLYYFVGKGAVYFASELKQLLAVPECSREIDLPAIHKYLTFSFVPGEAVPIVGVRRVLPGHIATFEELGPPKTQAYFVLEEKEHEAFRDRTTAVEALREVAKAGVTQRVAHGEPVALYLSGGLDSAAMAVWLRSRETKTTLLTLDFGAHSVEKAEAELVAKTVGFEHHLVPMTGADLGQRIPELASLLDLPFGDVVTGPQMMLGLAAKARGLRHVLNGEGGDQLFGGWTNKPMIAAEIFSSVATAANAEESREETYLRSYHRFYGVEDALYTDSFREAVGGPGQRRAHLAPYLAGERGESFLGRVRLADIALKGSQNILPRAERIAAGLGLTLSMPLFDRKLAEYSFRLPGEMKLYGACEKFVLKIAMQGRLPEEIIWRKKSGMSVPMTDWLEGPLRDVLEEYAGDKAIAARGWFKRDYVASLREGNDRPGETRRRRIGEKLWALVMLEAWVRHVVEGKATS
ncbi:MAG: 7-cyano-7-deazaguanine synthase [Deltaproteobacteria bacterium]|nr:7-cyano-7-deazaguanine synthase [Deltaproteobacteria bacterium]